MPYAQGFESTYVLSFYGKLMTLSPSLVILSPSLVISVLDFIG